MLIANDEPRVNDRIRAREVRVVAPDGSQVGVKSLEEALWLADQLGLDVVEVAPEARPPVVRLMDYGKWKYEQSVKARESRKRQTRTVIKEVKLRPKTDVHDFEVKRRRAHEFLEEGDKVKVTMQFRGREITHPEIGRGLLERMAEGLADVGSIEVMPRLEGRNMTMVIAPSRRPRADKPKRDRHESRDKERVDRSGSQGAAPEAEAPAAEAPAAEALATEALAAEAPATDATPAPEIAEPVAATPAAEAETPARESADTKGDVG